MNGTEWKTFLNLLMAISLLPLIISNVNCTYNCTGLGVFAKPQSKCRSYIICYEQNNSKFIADERVCPNDQIFNEYQSKCVPSQSYSCFDEPCTNRVGYFPKPNTNCQDYYLCTKVNNQSVANTYSCPNGSKFSPLLSRCDPKYVLCEMQQVQQADTQRPTLIQTVRPSVTTIKPTTKVVAIQTSSTTPGNIVAIIAAKPVTTKAPIQPTTTRKPSASCSTTCIMQTKTGLYAHATNPCSYVSCTRTADILYCANMKCDPGHAFAQQSGRCIASNLCTAKPKRN